MKGKMLTKLTGQCLRKFRKNKGLSLREVGELIGGSSQYVGALERAVTPVSLNVANKMRVALGLPLKDLKACLMKDFKNHLDTRLK
jgi:transcriptional regulator with XRE-family HTH domain